MVKIIGVRFRTAGKIYYFDPVDFEIKRGDHVIVETARGIEYGTVVGAPKEVEEDQIVSALKPVLRVATPRDVEQEADNKRKEKEAFKICQEKIKEHELEMKLIDAEYTFDNNKVLFYFTADGRIDFRDLVKDLASVFRTRIELRQIGVRDETKIRGGIGVCGRPLCCHSYLSDFVPVSIKMAKEQNLSLNPTKISGMCGRLMCCLKNEQETYEELNRKLPTVGDAVICPGGFKGEVNGVNVLRQTVRVLVEDGDNKEIKEFKATEIHFHHHKNSKVEITEEELQAVRELEEKNDVESLEPEETAYKPEKRQYRERNRDYRSNRGREENQGNNRRGAYESRENKNREAAAGKEYKNRETGAGRENKTREIAEGLEAGNKEGGNKETGNKDRNRSRRSRYERGTSADNGRSYDRSNDQGRQGAGSQSNGLNSKPGSSQSKNQNGQVGSGQSKNQNGQVGSSQSKNQNGQAGSSQSKNQNGQVGSGHSNDLNGQPGSNQSDGQNTRSGNANRHRGNYRGRKNRKAEGNEKSHET